MAEERLPSVSAGIVSAGLQVGPGQGSPRRSAAGAEAGWPAGEARSLGQRLGVGGRRGPAPESWGPGARPGCLPRGAGARTHPFWGTLHGGGKFSSDGPLPSPIFSVPLGLERHHQFVQRPLQ